MGEIKFIYALMSRTHISLSRPENDFQDKEMGATKVSPVIDKIQ
jgi:hypothetical protein